MNCGETYNEAREKTQRDGTPLKSEKAHEALLEVAVERIKRDIQDAVNQRLDGVEYSIEQLGMRVKMLERQVLALKGETMTEEAKEEKIVEGLPKGPPKAKSEIEVRLETIEKVINSLQDMNINTRKRLREVETDSCICSKCAGFKGNRPTRKNCECKDE